jgi:hypothetical protein
MSDRTGGGRAKSAAPVRFPRVARMVLYLATLSFVPPFMSACVLPIAPEFQDPPASRNFDPTFVVTEPKVGAAVTKASFRVTVTDPNVGDDLYVRWIANFPPASGDTRAIKDDFKRHSNDGTPLFAEFSIEPECIRDLVANLPSHRVMVVISDRPFLGLMQPGSPDIDYARIAPNAGRLIGTWTLDQLCMTGPNQ